MLLLMKLFRFLAALLILTAAAAITILMIPKPQAARPDGRLKVVAAENFWGDIARQIGGDSVQVTSIISDPDVDPHLYESNAGNAAAIGAADVVIVNGLGYDDFMDKLLAAAPADKRKVIKATDTLNTTANGNPHIWYGSSRVQLVAAAMETALAEKDPAHQTEYRKNLDDFNAAMLTVSTATAKIAANHAGEAVAYTERVPEFLLANAQLNVATPVGFSAALEGGNDASPADTAAMENLIAKRAIKALIYNPQAASPTTTRIRDMAAAAGIPVVTMTETMPADQPDFQTWQMSQIKQLEAALNAK